MTMFVISSLIDDGHDGGAPVTWTTIFDAIKGPLVQNIALTMKIYEYLKQQSGKCICNCFNYHCNIIRISNINYIISQYYMEYNKDDIAI